MAAITRDEVRELAGFKGQAPVTSCYLDVDGRRLVRHHDYELELDRLLRDAKRRANGHASVADDLRRIRDFVTGGFDRSHVRGLALFSCSADGFWRPLELPVPVRSQLVINKTPAVAQLEVILEDYEPFGVLLADKQRARMFVFHLGELVECKEEFDRLPRHDDDGGTWGKDHVQSHAAAVAHQHLRHAARVAFDVFRDTGFTHLVIGAPDEIARELEAELHPYLRERVAARLCVPIAASHDEVRQAALEVEEAVEREKERREVERLRDAVGAGRRGVAGLKPTLAALVERRVETLLVSHGYGAPGWRCEACDFIATVGRTCPVCQREMLQVEDVVEEAIDEALAQGCHVDICEGNADLDVLGRIGALLRF